MMSLAPMDDVFKAIADQSRRTLLDELYKQNGQTLGELCELLDMSRQAVTKHLVILEGAGLVVTFWQGRNKVHYLNAAPIHEISRRWLRKYDHQKLEALADLKHRLEHPGKNK